MAITQDITIPDEPPSSRDRVNFRLRADAFVAWMKTFATQIANLITQINSTETSVNAKEASATSAASTATTQAGIATTKAGEALASATAAHNAQLAAEAVFDNFDDKYLGAKAAAPTTDNDGNALTTGALFFKTTAPKGIYVYDAELGAWSIFSFIPTSHGSLSGRSDADVHPISSITGVSAFARTLLDDTSAEAARATLGAAPTASPTFSGTVTAPTFSGALNGNAATATNASAVNGVGVGSEGLPFFAGFGTDGKLAYYAGLNLDTLASTNRRCTFSGSVQAPTTGFYYLDQYAYQGGAYLMQVLADLDTTSHAMFLRKKVNNVWTAWKKIAVEDGSTNAYNVRVESARVADELNTTVGSAPSFSNRAWLCANGTTAALYASGNIAAVTDNGVCNFTANFLSALPHANYAVCGSASGVITQSRSATIAASAVNAPPYLKTAYGCRLFFGSNGANDADIFTVSFIC